MCVVVVGGCGEGCDGVVLMENNRCCILTPSPPSLPALHSTLIYNPTYTQAPPPLQEEDDKEAMLGGLVNYSSGEEETIGTSLPPTLPPTPPSFPSSCTPHIIIPLPLPRRAAKKLDEEEAEAKAAANAALAAASSSSSSDDDEDSDDESEEEDEEEEGGRGKRASSSSASLIDSIDKSKKPKLLPSALDLLATTEAPAFLSVPAPTAEFDVQPVVDTR